MECFILYIDDTLIAAIWIIISFWWILTTFITNKSYSVSLHLVLVCLLIPKILPALYLIFCELKSNSDFLKIIFFVAQGLIFAIKFSSPHATFFFSSIGLGYIPFNTIFIRFKLSLFMFLLSYSTGSALYLFGPAGHLLSSLYFQVLYIYTLDSILNTISLVLDNPKTFHKKQLKILNSSKNLIFLYCHLQSIIHFTIFILLFKSGPQASPNMTYSLHILIDLLDLILTTKLLYILRPRAKARFAFDFIFPSKAPIKPFLVSMLFDKAFQVSPPGCLIVFNDSFDCLKFGFMYKELA